MPWLLAAQSSMVVQEARLYLLFIPINVCTLLSLGALRGSRGLGLWNLIRITAGLSWLAVLLIAWVMEKETVMFVTRGFLAATLFLLLATWFLVPWWVSGPFRPKKTGLIPLLRYGLPSIFGAVPAQLNLRFDQLLMVALLPPQMLGFYAVTVSWNSGLLALGHSTAAVILPRLARLRLLADQTDVLARTLRLSVLLSGILGVPFLLMTPFAIKLLFGVAFVPAIPTAMVLVPATLISGINLVLADGLRGLGRPKWVMIAQLVGLVVTVVSLALLLRPYQIMGAAVASLLSYATILLLLVTFTVRETHMSVHVMLWPRREDLSRLWRVTWILRDHWVPDERRSQLSLYHKNPTGT
jgi:O-antigen/teichoic acid export membrane protein